MTTSVFEIIGLAENRAMQFDLPFPSAEPKLIITVRRMLREFENNAMFLAEGNMRLRNLTPDDPTYNLFFNTRYQYELVEFLKTHATGWKAADGSELKEKFNSAIFETWIKELDPADRVDLGGAYVKAVREDQKKLTPAVSGDQDSSTPSENGSSTT